MPLLRRRFLAFAAYAFGAGLTSRPLSALAALPPCKSDKQFGDWQLSIAPPDGPSINALDGKITYTAGSKSEGASINVIESTDMTAKPPTKKLVMSIQIRNLTVNGAALPNGTQYELYRTIVVGKEVALVGTQTSTLNIPPTTTLIALADKLSEQQLMALSDTGRIELVLVFKRPTEANFYNYGRFDFSSKGLKQAVESVAAESKRLESLAKAKKCEPGEGCFISSACCGSVGLPDDCWELRTLRRYRDTVLNMQSGGTELIEQYYRIAPAIARSLPAPQSLRLYFELVLPCATLISLGLHSWARSLYVRAVRRLAAAAAH